MPTVLIFVGIFLYFVGCIAAIGWAQASSNVAVSTKWERFGMLLWPTLLTRLTRWAIPDAWMWPKLWIGVGVWLVALLAMLLFYFKLRLGYALLIWGFVVASAVMLMLTAVPYLLSTP